MALETTIVEAWLYQLLTADTAIAALIGSAVYSSVAPQGAPKLYIVLGYQGGSDENAIGTRALAQPLYQVKAVGRHSDIATLRALADRIDALLQDTRVVTAGYQIRVQREGIIRNPEFDEGVEYQNLGGMYRCWVSLAA